MKKDPNKYPKGWNRERVERVIQHFDQMSAGEWIAEADAAWENSRMTLVRVPAQFADEVRRFIADRQRRADAPAPRRRKSA